MTSKTTEEIIKEQIATHSVLLYMKGTPEAPECGYSGAAVKALQQSGSSFNYVNVLASPFIREKLPSVSNWPTYPQLFVKSELVGGCDIILEMSKDGSLNKLLESADEESAVS